MERRFCLRCGSQMLPLIPNDSSEPVVHVCPFAHLIELSRASEPYTRVTLSPVDVYKREIRYWRESEENRHV